MTNREIIQQCAKQLNGVRDGLKSPVLDSILESAVDELEHADEIWDEYIGDREPGFDFQKAGNGG